MASEGNEISEIVKKCKVLLLDIEGTTTSVSFVKDILHPYADIHVREFLDTEWEKKEVRDVVILLRKLATEDATKKVEGVVPIPGSNATKEEQIEGLVNNFKWQVSIDRKVTPLKILQGLIWKKGYDVGEIKGHVYDDVAPALKLWNSTKGQVYIFSSGSVQAQKLLFKQTVAGDMLPLFAGHFDTAVGGKLEASSYVTIAEKVSCKVDEMLFLTDNINEAVAARTAGLHVALVSREGNEPLPAEASAFIVLHSFEQLAASNKRKPDPQERLVPAKVLKTDIEADVKTSEQEVIDTAVETTNTSETVDSSETVATSENITAVETVSKDGELEKMEVEEEVAVTETPTVGEKVDKNSEKTEGTPVRVETIIEEITNPNEAVDAPVCEIKPVVIEESVEKTDKIETETMEIETSEKVEAVEIAIKPEEPAPAKVDEQNAPVTKESPTAVITIQEITNDQQNINEAAEVVEDLEPVIEEPPAVEMEELKNVGEVLDKECDEILLKVQGITNLDNMNVKPMLHSIAEETMDAENGENTNDIVESILDSEMELNEKPCEDIDISTVQEITDTKADVAEDISEMDKEKVEDATIVAEEKTAKTAANTEKNVVDENKDKEEKLDKLTPTEKETQEAKTPEAKIDEIIQDENAVTNKHEGESIPKPAEENVKTAESVTDCKSKVVEIKKASAETVVNECDNKEALMESDGKQMKIEESAVAENKSEIKENIADPAHTKVDIHEKIVEAVDNKVEIKECIEEKVDSEMNSVDSTAKPAEILKESEESATLSVENKSEKESVGVQEDEKMESEDNTTESIKNKPEIKESMLEQTNNIMELVENDSEAKESIPDQANNKVESVENEVEIKENIPKQVTNKMESDDSTAVPVENKMETEESMPEDSKMEESITKPNAAVPESKVNENDKKETPEAIVPKAVTEPKESASRDIEMETDATEKQINGNSNGEPEVNQNGDASKSEELSARLSVENGENGKEVNGANGNDNSAEEKGQGDNKVETEIQDIKVKSVASEEPRTDTIEQPVEA